MTDLTFATLDELIDELKRRSSSYAVVVLVPMDGEPSMQHGRRWSNCSLGQALVLQGLVTTLGHDVDRYVRAQEEE